MTVVKNSEIDFMRVFFGIPIGEKDLLLFKRMILDQLTDNRSKSVRWIKSENCHLTLKFIEKIQKTLISELILSVESSLKEVPSFKVELKKIHQFPRPYSSIIAVHAVKNEMLENIFYQLEQNGKILNIPKEVRDFNPHITLIRNKESESFTIKPIYFENYFIPVDEIILYQSLSQTGGSMYVPLHHFKLKNPVA